MSTRRCFRRAISATLACSVSCYIGPLNAGIMHQGRYFCRGSSILGAQDVPIRASEEQPADHDSHACGSGGTHITHRILFKGEEVPAMHGETLRTALLKTGKVTPHNAQAQLINCRGLGTCGTCAVEIKGAVEPKAWNTKERLRLNFPPHSAPNSLKLRLACQVRVHGDLQVTKYNRFWGEGNDETKDRSFSMPFAELEFLLDSNSMPDPPEAFRRPVRAREGSK